MKTLKLSSLAQNALSEREMNAYVGGNECGCACRSNNTLDNSYANDAGGLQSPDTSMEEMVYVLEPAVVVAYK